MTTSLSTAEPRPITVPSPIRARSRTKDWSPRIAPAPISAPANTIARAQTTAPAPSTSGGGAAPRRRGVAGELRRLAEDRAVLDLAAVADHRPGVDDDVGAEAHVRRRSGRRRRAAGPGRGRTAAGRSRGHPTSERRRDPRRRRGRRRRAAGASAGGAPLQRARRAASASRSTSTFQPASTVSVHSVVARSVTHGTPARYASFWTPPESVSSARAWCSSAVKSR